MEVCERNGNANGVQMYVIESTLKIEINANISAN